MLLRMPSSPFRDLQRLFASIKNEKEAELFLEDMFTASERASLVERWRLIQALASGMTQRDINKKLKISISKITRGSKMLKHGSGGFGLFLKRLKK